MRIDHSELAWAAGFFDGEGSTMAIADNRRPGYLRLSLSLPQSDREHVPETLVRFQRAVLGMGAISPPLGGFVYRWRSRGFVDSQATIALLWGFLGRAKRIQAARAMQLVRDQYQSGDRRHRRPRATVIRNEHAANPRSRLPEEHAVVDRAWAAGLFEAEGWLGVKRSANLLGTLSWLRLCASVSQHAPDGAVPEVLLRFHQVVGVGRIERHGDLDDFKWVCSRAQDIRRVIEWLRPYLGDRKQRQAEDAFRRFSAQPRTRGTSDRCKRGHSYDELRKRGDRMRRSCRLCTRLTDRARRAARGIAPRPFRNGSRRYTA